MALAHDCNPNERLLEVFNAQRVHSDPQHVLLLLTHGRGPLPHECPENEDHLIVRDHPRHDLLIVAKLRELSEVDPLQAVPAHLLLVHDREVLEHLAQGLLISLEDHLYLFALIESLYLLPLSLLIAQLLLVLLKERDHLLLLVDFILLLQLLHLLLESLGLFLILPLLLELLPQRLLLLAEKLLLLLGPTGLLGFLLRFFFPLLCFLLLLLRSLGLLDRLALDV